MDPPRDIPGHSPRAALLAQGRVVTYPSSGWQRTTPELRPEPVASVSYRCAVSPIPRET
jgi:hypothetical protein